MNQIIMEVTKSSLEQKYATLETGDLLEIVSNRNDYESVAVSIALDELKKRKVPKEEISQYVSKIAYRPDQATIDKYFIDLNFFQKLISYFFILPLYRSYFTMPFTTNGTALKAQQANYYLVAGVSFLILAAISTNFYSSSFFPVWLSGFLLAYLFDIGFNKKRQINDIQQKVDKGKNPFDF